MKKKPEKKPRKRLSDKEWAEIRTEYASSSASYRTLAEKYGLSFNTLKDRATNEHWTADRKKYRESYAKKTQQKLARARAGACARDMNNIGAAAGNISDVIKKLLKDSEQLKRYIVTEAVGKGHTETSEKIFDKVDTRALRDITAAMKDLTYVIRDVYGVPRAAEQSAMDIAMARLAMDRERADKENGGKDIKLYVIEPEEAEVKQEDGN